MTTRQTISINPLSATSLRIWPRVNKKQVGTATGFVVKVSDKPYLITNWHVVTGLDPNNNKQIFAEPDELLIHHHSKGKLGSWVEKIEPLHNANGEPRWFEHVKGNNVDVIVLPLEDDAAFDIHALDLNLADTDMVPEPAMPVSIIGYPWGLSVGGGWPVWKTGHIASDPDLNYNSLPSFLVDVTARAGMSGSPVVLRMSGGFKTRSGDTIMSQSGASTLFLGVYAAQHQREELGIIWKPQVVKEILGSL